MTKPKKLYQEILSLRNDMHYNAEILNKWTASMVCPICNVHQLNGAYNFGIFTHKGLLKMQGIEIIPFCTACARKEYLYDLSFDSVIYFLVKEDNKKDFVSAVDIEKFKKAYIKVYGNISKETLAIKEKNVITNTIIVKYISKFRWFETQLIPEYLVYENPSYENDYHAQSNRAFRRRGGYTTKNYLLTDTTPAIKPPEKIVKKQIKIYSELKFKEIVNAI